MSRRPLTIVASVCCTAVLTGCSTSGRPGDVLQDRIGRAATPASFTMAYRATGTAVLDCFVPNRAFILEVRADTVVARRGADRSDVLAVRRGGSLELSPALFEPGPLQQRWLAVELTALRRTARAALVELLGVDLTSYLLADALPPNAQEIASAAFDAAADVESLGPETIANEATDGVRITLDPERYAEAQATESSPSGALDAATPGVDVWIDARGNVVRVAVSAGAASADETRGWVITFGSPPMAATPVTGSTTPIASVDLTRLSAATTDCEL